MSRRYEGARSPSAMATLAVAFALVTAGCIGSLTGSPATPTANHQDDDNRDSDRGNRTVAPDEPEDPGREGAEFCDPPLDYFPVDTSASPLVTRTDNGSSTTYHVNDSALDYKDQVFTVALRAEEDLRVGYTISEWLEIDDHPSQGWMHVNAVVVGAPVCGLGGPDSGTVTGSLRHWFRTSVWHGEGDVKARATVDGASVVDRSLDEPCIELCTVDLGTDSEGMMNLSAGEWVLVRTGGMAPDRLGDGTRVETRLRVTGNVSVFSPPARDLIWGTGWGHRLDDAAVHLEMGTKEYLRDGTVLREMESARYLSIDTRTARLDQDGSGLGRIVFSGHNRSIPNASWATFSSPDPGRIGFEVDEWMGKPDWYLMDAWLPTMDNPSEDG